MRSQFSERYFADVQVELARERGNALGRAGRRVEAHMARCDELGALLSREASPSEELLEDYRAERASFDQALWAYKVHREAIGLHDHTWVHRVYRRPPAR